jgi:hypothetical protein
MAKALGEKSRLIRKALADHPGVGNTDLAKQLNEKHKGLDIKATDVANQRTALKKLAEGRAEEEESFDDPSFSKSPPPAPRAAASSSPAVPSTATSGLTVEDMATLRALVAKVGGVDALIKWLELLRGMR